MEKEVRPDYERLFEAPFDFAAYIETRLRDISNLEERRFAKTILEDCLLKGIQQTETKYERLERRIYDEFECKDSKFVIYTTIIPREVYDPIGDFLYPICPEDLPPDQYDTGVFLEKLENKDSVWVSRVFAECGHDLCKELPKRRFQGKLLLDDGRELGGTFLLCPDSRYIESIRLFYELYCNNGITWTTINSAYLEKCFSLELERLEHPLAAQDKVVGFSLEFGELSDVLHYNFLPLWNVEKLSVDSADFMVPCVDSVGWEHKVSVVELGVQNEYLIYVTDAIRSFRREKNDIIILTDGQKMPELTVYKIAQPNGKLPAGYDRPLLNNSKKDCFTRRYTAHCNKSLLTRVELLRRIHELDFEQFLEFQGVEFVEADHFISQAYSMNPFVNDEIVDKKSKRILLFTFRKLEENGYLNGDILSFLISQLQLSFNEYRCEGVLA